jgi:hypothetical protein
MKDALVAAGSLLFFMSLRSRPLGDLAVAVMKDALVARGSARESASPRFAMNVNPVASLQTAEKRSSWSHRRAPVAAGSLLFFMSLRSKPLEKFGCGRHEGCACCARFGTRTGLTVFPVATLQTAGDYGCGGNERCA